MPSRRRPRSLPARVDLPPQVPEVAKADKPTPAEGQAEADLLPDDLRKMLEAAYA